MSNENSYILPAFFVLLYFVFKLSRGIKKLKGKKVKKMNDWARLEKEAKRTKAAYPEGTRLMLLHMDDAHAPVPEGTKGTVKHVDDLGQIHMEWDNGRTLAIVPGVDSFRTLTEEELREEGNIKEDAELEENEGDEPKEDADFDEDIDSEDFGMTQTM